MSLCVPILLLLSMILSKSSAQDFDGAWYTRNEDLHRYFFTHERFNWEDARDSRAETFPKNWIRIRDMLRYVYTERGHAKFQTNLHSILSAIFTYKWHQNVKFMRFCSVFAFGRGKAMRLLQGSVQKWNFLAALLGLTELQCVNVVDRAVFNVRVDKNLAKTYKHFCQNSTILHCFMLKSLSGPVACLDFGFVSELGHVTHPCTRNFTFSPSAQVCAKSAEMRSLGSASALYFCQTLAALFSAFFHNCLRFYLRFFKHAKMTQKAYDTTNNRILLV